MSGGIWKKFFCFLHVWLDRGLHFIQSNINIYTHTHTLTHGGQLFSAQIYEWNTRHPHVVHLHAHSSLPYIIIQHTLGRLNLCSPQHNHTTTTTTTTTTNTFACRQASPRFDCSHLNTMRKHSARAQRLEWPPIAFARPRVFDASCVFHCGQLISAKRTQTQSTAIDPNPRNVTQTRTHCQREKKCNIRMHSLGVFVCICMDISLSWKWADVRVWSPRFAHKKTSRL